MEGSRIDSRANWKHSVVKRSPDDSRIFADAKDLPSKFSPTRLNHPVNISKSLIRNRISGYSQDEISLRQDKDRSLSKDAVVDGRETIRTPRSVSEKQNIFKAVKGENSEKSVDLSANKVPALKGVSFQTQNAKDAEVVRELKAEFLRFKERVMKQLQKQQEDLKRTIEEIYSLISQNSSSRVNMQSLGQSNIVLRPVSISIPAPSKPIILHKDSPIQAKSPSHVDEENVSLDLSKYRRQLSQRTMYEAVVPKIRERMDKFLELMNKLKREINDRSFERLSPSKYMQEVQ